LFDIEFPKAENVQENGRGQGHKKGGKQSLNMISTVNITGYGYGKQAGGDD